MAVVNANYEFVMEDIGINGRISDGGVISHTKFGKMLNNNLLQIPDPEKLRNSDRYYHMYLLLAYLMQGLEYYKELYYYHQKKLK